MGVSHATAEELVRDLFELQRVTRKVLKAAALHRELSMVHTNILSYLACVPGRRAKDIVAESGLGASGMSRHLSALEHLGYVTRTRDLEDGRAQIVEITAEGRKALEANLRADTETLVARLGDLGEDEAERTRVDLNRLTELFLTSLGMSRVTAATIAPEPGAQPGSPHPTASGDPGRGKENSP